MKAPFIKRLFLILIGVNVFLLLFFFSSTGSDHQNQRKENVNLLQQVGTDLEIGDSDNTSNNNARPEEYQFKDPILAIKILEKLDVFTPFYRGSKEKSEKYYEKRFLGSSKDKDYCQKQRAFWANNASYIFTERNIICSALPGSQVKRNAVNKYGTNVMKDFGTGGERGKKLKSGFSLQLKPEIMAFFTAADMFKFRMIDQQFSCLAQMSNHVPGHGSLYRKDMAAAGVNVYAKTYLDRPQCFNFNKFFPKTFLLYKEDQCKAFFEEINSKGYKKLKKQRNIVYMRKIGNGVHAGRGVFPVTDAEEQNIRTKYKNGTLCGKKHDNNILQTFIHNPLLINGRKFDFRMYFLIASVNPIIAYYHDGCLRVSLQEYTTKDGNKKTLLTNTAMNKFMFKEAKKNGTYMGKTTKDLKEDHSWTFKRFGDYVLKEELVDDPNWLDNYLRPQFKEAMIHLVRMSQHSFHKQSSLYELYGLDFMLDDNMNLWFIEGNVRPALEGHTPDNKRLKMNMVMDHFEIVFGILRSRMKRVFLYVNNMILNDEAEIDSDGEVDIPDLKEKRKEFQELIKNYYEPEFVPRKENGFSLVINENLAGAKKYGGYLKEECL